RRPERRQAGAAARFGERDRRPADLLARPRVDPGAEGARHQLAPQADAEGRQVPGEARLEHLQFVANERIRLVLVSADRSPEDNEEVRRLPLEGGQVVRPRLHVLDAVATSGQDRLEGPEVFEGYVADRDRALPWRRGRPPRTSSGPPAAGHRARRSEWGSRPLPSPAVRIVGAAHACLRNSIATEPERTRPRAGGQAPARRRHRPNVPTPARRSLGKSRAPDAPAAAPRRRRSAKRSRGRAGSESEGAAA